MLQDGLSECRLQTRHLGYRAGWFEAHYQRILCVFDVWDDALGSCLRRGIVLVLVIGLIARPVAALQIQYETWGLVAALVRPAEVDTVKIGSVAVA